MRILKLLLAIFLLTSCNNQEKIKELELKERQLDLKERELQLIQNKKDDAKKLKKEASENRSELNSKLEKLYGYWEQKQTPFNMNFYRNGRFNFNDYNDAKNIHEHLTGEYELSGSTLILKYDDRHAQKFKFIKRMGQWSIIKGKYYLTKN